jgi:hypothetical protein
VSYWTVVRTAIACLGGCRRQIGAGEAVRLVSAGEYPFCVQCVKRRFDLDPPAAMPSAALPPLALGMSKLPRDFKVAQSKDGE